METLILMTCVLLLLIAFLQMVFEKIPYTSANERKLIQRHIINNSYGYKPHLKMA